MKKIIGALCIVVTILAGVYAAARYGSPPVVSLLDQYHLTEVLKLTDGVVATVPEASENIEDIVGFSYSTLSDTEAKVYIGLYHAAKQRLKHFTMLNEHSYDIQPALNALLEDHPEFFYLTGYCTYANLHGSLRYEIDLEYGVDPKEIDALQTQIDEATKTYFNQITSQTNSYEKAKLAYEFIINNTDYSFESPNNQNILSVFLEHKSVCAGYARAYQYLLEKAGVPCIYIYGTVKANHSTTEEDEIHAWNLVNIDGVYTYVDPTWGDPTYSGLREAKITGTISYDYLCLTREEMERDGHFALYGDGLPAAKDHNWDYYRVNGSYFEGYDYAVIDDAIQAAIDQGKTDVAFKFANDDAYLAAYSDAEAGTYLHGAFQTQAIRLGRPTITYQYSGNPALRIVRFYWE